MCVRFRVRGGKMVLYIVDRVSLFIWSWWFNDYKLEGNGRVNRVIWRGG